MFKFIRLNPAILMKRSFSLSFYLFTLAFFFVLTSCQVSRSIYYNVANITDHTIFPSRNLTNDSVKFYYSEAVKTRVPKTISFKGEDITFDEFLKTNATVAFLIIKNDTIQYENYFNGYDESSIVSSFSMAKSITSILIGCAIDDGLIKSVDEPIVNYIPELSKNGLNKVTIKHLLQMTSGIEFKESYINPFADVATFYYGTDLEEAVENRRPEVEPGTKFRYSSGDTQVLGLVLERALKNKTITEYLEEKIWRPLGMEYDASWSLDHKGGLEKTFCCINARARDFAKIGRLYLNKGNWNGKQIVSKEWVEQSLMQDTTAGGVPYFKYQWWLTSTGAYMAKGVLGQFIYVDPAKNLTIVRLGKNYGNVDWRDVFPVLSENY